MGALGRTVPRACLTEQGRCFRIIIEVAGVLYPGARHWYVPSLVHGVAH